MSSPILILQYLLLLFSLVIRSEVMSAHGLAIYHMVVGKGQD